MTRLNKNTRHISRNIFDLYLFDMLQQLFFSYFLNTLYYISCNLKQMFGRKLLGKFVFFFTIIFCTKPKNCPYADGKFKFKTQYIPRSNTVACSREHRSSKYKTCVPVRSTLLLFPKKMLGPGLFCSGVYSAY